VAQVTTREVTRTLGRMVQTIESDRIGRDTLREFASQAPEELAPLLSALHRAHARLRAAVAQLESDRAQMAAIFEHMADGVLVLGPDERVELSNPAAQRLLRVAPMSGRRLAEVARDPELVEIARAASAVQPVIQVVELTQGPAAPHKWLQVVATRLPSDESRTLLLLQDVSELRWVEAARRDFVANVSHELRTPVAALKALVETLEAGVLEEDPQEGRDFLRRMHVEVDGLAHLISELLELARVEAGRLELDLAPCAPDELLRAAVDRLRPYARRLDLSIEVAEPAAETLVNVDARRIGQVLANLLSNAVKFTPPGGRIEVGSRAAGESVEFWVSDTGIGIHPEHLVRVFERFYKIDSSRTGSGTGLGLALAKHLVRAHGGTIWAESEGEGRGATFRFTLPAVGALSSPERPPWQSRSPARAAPG
jgi:two-component system phosphate regulon sensor histidine kinase PhoR